MVLNERQEAILDQLRVKDKIEVGTLSHNFRVTAQTIRRDLKDLCDRGLVTRTHGGAKRFISTVSRGYEERRLSFKTEKEAIGILAASLIPDNCSIILNIGTTTEQVARALTSHSNLIIISNNINVIQIFMNSQLKDLILAGGGVRQSDGAIVGDHAVELISHYKADYAVIGTSSIDSDGAILDFDACEVAVARAILKNSRVKILVSDISKFERSAPVRICDVIDLDYVILDKQPPKNFYAAALRGGTRIITTEQMFQSKKKNA